MTDLTKIEKPFVFLDSKTQKALMECGGPWEVLTIHGEWRIVFCPAFGPGNVYRQKPQPREYEVWKVVRSNGDHFAYIHSEQSARESAIGIGGRVIRMEGRDE